MSRTVKLSDTILADGGLEVLEAARQAGFPSPQVCRAIVNLSKSGMYPFPKGGGGSDTEHLHQSSAKGRLLL